MTTNRRLQQAPTTVRPAKAKQSPVKKLNPKRVARFVDEIFGESEHEARVKSMANAVVGITQAAVLAIHAIGQAYAQVAGITAKSGVKQVDRLLSSDNFVLAVALRAWVLFVIGARKQAVIALDWTEFDDDDCSTLAAFLVSNHGRATPLFWRTHRKSGLKGNQKRYELELLEQLVEWLPDVEATLLADRGFGDQKLYDFLVLRGWHYVIRFRKDILVTAADGQRKTAAAWVPETGRAKMLKLPKVTADGCLVSTTVQADGLPPGSEHAC